MVGAIYDMRYPRPMRGDQIRSLHEIFVGEVFLPRKVSEVKWWDPHVFLRVAVWDGKNGTISQFPTHPSQSYPLVSYCSPLPYTSKYLLRFGVLGMFFGVQVPSQEVFGCQGLFLWMEGSVLFLEFPILYWIGDRIVQWFLSMLSGL